MLFKEFLLPDFLEERAVFTANNLLHMSAACRLCTDEATTLHLSSAAAAQLGIPLCPTCPTYNTQQLKRFSSLIAEVSSLHLLRFSPSKPFPLPALMSAAYAFHYLPNIKVLSDDAVLPLRELLAEKSLLLRTEFTCPEAVAAFADSLHHTLPASFTSEIKVSHFIMPSSTRAPLHLLCVLLFSVMKSDQFDLLRTPLPLSFFFASPLFGTPYTAFSPNASRLVEETAFALFKDDMTLSDAFRVAESLAG